MLKDLWKVLRGELSSSLLREKDNQLTHVLARNRDMILDHERMLVLWCTQVQPMLRGLGRVIGKIDPMYAADPHDPKRMEESNRIADEVICRLRAESDVQRKLT